jgi:hypothetical protein
VTVSVCFKWEILMFHSDDIWATEVEARADAVRYAHKFHIPDNEIKIYKTTIEVF